ncbi:hypothetical protein Bca4012_029048 [Brassica carinata]|uniref:Uncharacterized protein n=1 Tax=Brassica carinata TaxID=52824 RepID=A0A8X7RIP0_BRACI|nr:hypothetical protein Bca52824_049487 [Brassica carinata]
MISSAREIYSEAKPKMFHRVSRNPSFRRKKGEAAKARTNPGLVVISRFGVAGFVNSNVAIE